VLVTYPFPREEALGLASGKHEARRDQASEREGQAVGCQIGEWGNLSPTNVKPRVMAASITQGAADQMGRFWGLAGVAAAEPRSRDEFHCADSPVWPWGDDRRRWVLTADSLS
jgi:hypothetical protein